MIFCCFLCLFGFRYFSAKIADSPEFPGVPRSSPEFPGIPRSSPEFVLESYGFSPEPTPLAGKAIKTLVFLEN